MTYREWPGKSRKGTLVSRSRAAAALEARARHIHPAGGGGQSSRRTAGVRLESRKRTGGPCGTLAHEEAARTAVKLRAMAARRDAILSEESILSIEEEREG